MLRRALLVIALSLGGCQCLEPVGEDDAGHDAGAMDAGFDGGATCAPAACTEAAALNHCNGTEGTSCIEHRCVTECPDEGAGRSCTVNQATYCLECGGDGGTHCPMSGTASCGFPQTQGTAQIEASSCDLTELSLMRTASAQCRYFTTLADGGVLGEIWKLEDSEYLAYFPGLGGWCTGRSAYTGAPRAIINCPSCRFVVLGFE